MPRTAIRALVAEKRRALVVQRPVPGADPLTVAQMRDYLLAAGLAIQKVPERVEIVEALPMTATGKVQKNLLREDVARKVRG